MRTKSLPPAQLADRVGRLEVTDGTDDGYLQFGSLLRDIVASTLPEDWSWDGKRVLDFGCGAGRVLRHFEVEADVAEFSGCDIDATSIDWLNRHLNPPFSGFVNAPRPPLPRPDEAFDLIYALSVFTHLTDDWSAWLLELHRLLAPGGLLIATFLGEGMSEAIVGEPWDETRVGMNVLKAHQGWDKGGPMVLMSPWWIEEHWGRAFQIVELTPGTTSGMHGCVVARPRPEAPTRVELERIDPRDERELASLRHNLRQVQQESATTAAELERTVRWFESSRSWRLTAPLRRARQRAG